MVGNCLSEVIGTGPSAMYAYTIIMIFRLFIIIGFDLLHRSKEFGIRQNCGLIELWNVETSVGFHAEYKIPRKSLFLQGV